MRLAVVFSSRLRYLQSMATKTSETLPTLASFRTGYRLACATAADARPLSNRGEELGFACASARVRTGATISRVDSLRLSTSDLADWMVL